MKRFIFGLISILPFLASASTSPEQARMQAFKMAMVQNQISQIQSEMGKKLREQARLQSEIKQFQQDLGPAKILHLVGRMHKIESQIAADKNDLRQVEVDLKGLREQQAKLMGSSKTVNQ